MSEALLKVRGLKKHFPVQESFLKRLFSKSQEYIHAVDGVDFDIKKNEVLGLVGESGSGKTTVGKLVLRLIEPTEGQIFFDSKEVVKLSSEEMRQLRRDMQIVFQDPYSSLNPKMRVGDCVAHPLRIHENLSKQDARDKVMEMLGRVGLDPAEAFYEKYPNQLSGGQRQRVAIARSLILHPKFVVADEPTSMLDVSVNAQIINLMLDLKKQFDLTYLYITHDIATAKYICDKIALMYLGEIVESGSFQDVYQNPKHPYTMALLSAVPVPNPSVQMHQMDVKGEIPDAKNPPKGCRFHPRCPYKKPICEAEVPKLERIEWDRYVACHRHRELTGEAEKFVKHLTAS